MISTTSILFGVFAIINQSTAHFLLNYPPTIGFDDSLETTAPCGSFTPDFSKDNVTDFHVGGDAISVTSIHPQATWLFRATLDQTASGNWTDLLPSIQQSGLGAYCETDLKISSTWAGSKGILQIVQDAPDGILFQCAAVNFVSGAASGLPSGCKNVTGLSATYSADPALSTLASGTVTSTGSATSTSTSTTSASSTAKASGATGSFSTGELSSMMWLVGIGSLAMVASLL